MYLQLILEFSVFPWVGCQLFLKQMPAIQLWITQLLKATETASVSIENKIIR